MQNMAVNALAESLAAFLFLIQNVMHHFEQISNIIYKTVKRSKEKKHV